jgi:hypothetical protein
MGLKSLLPHLLPFEYREQVLGDLAERGYRLRDVVSVLPGLWWTAIRREYVGPIPDYTVSDATLEERVAELHRQNAKILLPNALAVPVLKGLDWVGFDAATALGGGLLAYVFVRLGLRVWTPRYSPYTTATSEPSLSLFPRKGPVTPPAIATYRALLQARLLTPILRLNLTLSLARAAAALHPAVWGVAVAMFLHDVHRAWRAQQELRGSTGVSKGLGGMRG